MSDSEPTSRRGRRARALSPEESAALESRTASMITGELSPVPGARGAVAAPEADAPVPKLRKFGRRARIIELSEPIGEQTKTHGATGTSDETGGQTAAGAPQGRPEPQHASDAADHEAPGSAVAPDSSDPDPETPGPDSLDEADAPSSGAAPQPARRAIGIDRDRDGVELGELPVSEAPDPRPAPRFDGKVLHRPERSGGRSLLWVVWVLIAVALVVLITLMVTGVLGQDSAAAVTSLDLAVPDLSDLFSARPALEEAAA